MTCQINGDIGDGFQAKIYRMRAVKRSQLVLTVVTWHRTPRRAV
jgi:hypothetical protein